MLSSVIRPSAAMLGFVSTNDSPVWTENMALAHGSGYPTYISSPAWNVTMHFYIKEVVLFSLLAAFLLTCVSCLYNIFFHPLAKYPGPWLAKVTSVYAAYYNWQGNPHLQIHRLHRKYGDYVRWTPDALLMNTPGALQDLYRAGEKVKKHHGYSMLTTIPNTLSSHEEPVHKQKKKVISKTLSQMAIREHEKTIVADIQKLISCITDSTHSNPWTAPFNMADWFDYLMLDVMGKMAFGVDLDIVGNAENQSFMKSLIEAIKTTQVRSIVLSYLPQLQKWNLDRFIFMKECLAGLRFVKYVSKIVLGRLSGDASESHGKDILSNLIGSIDPATGRKMTRGSLVSESAMLIIAGADTSATTLSALFFYLVRNPAAYERLGSELRGAFADASSICLGPQLSSCTYLRACIDETLRMTPPVGSIIPREVLPGGAVIDGHFFPAGTGVGTGIYAIQHHASLGDPFVWRPERWLEEDTAILRAHFNAWSAGSTACAGQHLAKAEMMLTMAFMFVQFDFRHSQEGSEEERRLGEGGWKGCEKARRRKEEYQLWDHVTSAKDGPMVQFRLRNLDAELR